MTGLYPEDRLEIEGLLTEFAWRVDHGEGGAVGDLFTEDGVVATPMFEFKGRAEIARRFAERAQAAGRVSRHVWTNPRMTPLSDNRARVQSIVQTYVGHGETPTVPEDLMVGDSLDVVEKGADGRWRFVERRLVVAFTKGGRKS